MSTAILTPGETRWGHPPEQQPSGTAEKQPSATGSLQVRTESHASWPPRPGDTIVQTSLARIMDEFVKLVKDNPKVWAVYATEDPSGITVWTYIDSTDRNDRSPVYETEWRLLNMYPEVGFDFNTALVPAGNEQFDDGEGVYVYRR